MYSMTKRARALLPAAAAAALLLTCATTRAQTDCAALAPETRIEPLGRFSNTRYTEEHAYGYDVLLWKAERCLIGLLFYSPGGLAGDTPTGVLESVVYVPDSGALSFAAKITAGLLATSENGALVSRPSQDYFTFRGTLDLERKTLSGTMEHALRNAPASGQPDAERIELPAQDSPGGVYPSSPTYGEWRAQLEPILRARGPQW